MEAVRFEAKKREKFGKGASRQDRAAGFLPANLYGLEEAPVSL
ncbi:MAG: 50S ribosomal protein L25, partial [Nitrospinota bacterium]